MLREKIIIIFVVLIVGGIIVGLLEFFRPIKKSSSEALPQLLNAEPERLKAHVTALTSTSEPRSYTNQKGLNEAAEYIANTWKATGLPVEFQTFEAGGRQYKNVVTFVGREDAPRIVLGAHYDVAGENPGADDNGSGVAGILELGRILAAYKNNLKHRIDLVAYCLEEPPFFGGSEMGSAVHARSLKQKNIKVDLMLSLEMIGYFTDKPKSQEFPLPMLKAIYPNEGNFIAVVGDLGSIGLTKKVKALMAKGSKVDVQFINAPKSVPGVDFSDHRSYWDAGYPALMITDTAFYRNPNYHTSVDTVSTLNFEKMAEVVNGTAYMAVNF